MSVSQGNKIGHIQLGSPGLVNFGSFGSVSVVILIAKTTCFKSITVPDMLLVVGRRNGMECLPSLHIPLDGSSRGHVGSALQQLEHKAL